MLVPDLANHGSHDRHRYLVCHQKRSTMSMSVPEFGNPSDLGLLPECENIRPLYHKILLS